MSAALASIARLYPLYHAQMATKPALVKHDSQKKHHGGLKWDEHNLEVNEKIKVWLAQARHKCSAAAERLRPRSCTAPQQWPQGSVVASVPAGTIQARASGCAYAYAG